MTDLVYRRVLGRVSPAIEYLVAGQSGEAPPWPVIKRIDIEEWETGLCLRCLVERHPLKWKVNWYDGSSSIVNGEPVSTGRDSPAVSCELV